MIFIRNHHKPSSSQRLVISIVKQFVQKLNKELEGLRSDAIISYAEGKIQIDRIETKEQISKANKKKEEKGFELDFDKGKKAIDDMGKNFMNSIRNMVTSDNKDKIQTDLDYIDKAEEEVENRLLGNDKKGSHFNNLGEGFMSIGNKTKDIASNTKDFFEKTTKSVFGDKEEMNNSTKAKEE